MDHEEAKTLLTVQRDACNAALDSLGLYRQETGAKRWTDEAVKSAQRTEIKALALKGGVDLSNWRGNDEPPPSLPE